MRRRRDRGYAFLVALLVLVVATTAALLVAASLGRRMELLRRESRDAQLQALVDAGLAQTLARLWSNPDYSSRGEAEPFAGGTIAVTTKKLSGLAVEVEVRATVGGFVRAARAVVEIDRNASPDPPEVRTWEPLRP